MLLVNTRMRNEVVCCVMQIMRKHSIVWIMSYKTALTSWRALIDFGVLFTLQILSFLNFWVCKSEVIRLSICNIACSRLDLCHVFENLIRGIISNASMNYEWHLYHWGVTANTVSLPILITYHSSVSFNSAYIIWAHQENAEPTLRIYLGSQLTFFRLKKLASFL